MTLIANIIDFLASILMVASGSIKKKARILTVQIVQLLMQATSMLLVGGITHSVHISHLLPGHRATVAAFGYLSGSSMVIQ